MIILRYPKAPIWTTILNHDHPKAPGYLSILKTVGSTFPLSSYVRSPRLSIIAPEEAFQLLSPGVSDRPVCWKPLEPVMAKAYEMAGLQLVKEQRAGEGIAWTDGCQQKADHVCWEKMKIGIDDGWKNAS